MNEKNALTHNKQKGGRFTLVKIQYFMFAMAIYFNLIV